MPALHRLSIAHIYIYRHVTYIYIHVTMTLRPPASLYTLAYAVVRQCCRVCHSAHSRAPQTCRGIRVVWCEKVDVDPCVVYSAGVQKSEGKEIVGCAILYIYVHIYTYMYTYVHTYMCTYICRYIHMNIYVYTYMCVYIYIYIWLSTSLYRASSELRVYHPTRRGREGVREERERVRDYPR